MLTFGHLLEYRVRGLRGQDGWCRRLQASFGEFWSSVELLTRQQGLRRKIVDASGWDGDGAVGGETHDQIVNVAGVSAVWLWRRSGNCRLEGVIERGAQGLVERVGLIESVVEQVGLMGRQTRWIDGWKSGGDAEVVQDFGHCGRGCDQGQKEHLRLASGAFEPIEPEASFE